MSTDEKFVGLVMLLFVQLLQGVGPVGAMVNVL